MIVVVKVPHEIMLAVTGKILGETMRATEVPGHERSYETDFFIHGKRR